jgi:ABC-type lipoprotein release transport system permease subunit
MSAALVSLRMLVLIAMRNLFSHKVKNGIVGSIMLFGTFLVVVGTSLLDSVESSMQNVVTSSLSGQIQVYSSKGRDPLSLFGNLVASLPDIGEVEDFSAIKPRLLAVENVESVVPMGMTIVSGTGGNDIDRMLGELRRAVGEGDEARQAELVAQVRQLIEFMEREYTLQENISTNKEKVARDRETLTHVTGASFWDEEFVQDPQAALLYLDTRLAPLAADGRLFFLRIIGTDPTLFRAKFDKFEMWKGEAIPDGKRGLLISRRVYERFMKNKVARDLDSLKEKMELDGLTIAGDAALASDVVRLSRQYQRVVYQLDPKEIAVLEPKLRAYLGAAVSDVKAGDIAGLIERFLLVTDENFKERYKFFYDEITPFMQLHTNQVGDTITLQAFTRRGYVRAVNVKLWGIYQFKGIEDSDLAGAVNLSDLVTFRELYGKMTEAQQQELAEIREEIGVEAVDRAGAEDALFGEDAEVAAVKLEGDAEQGFDEFADAQILKAEDRAAAVTGLTYTQEELERGVVLNMAVLLKDKTKIDETVEALNAMFARESLPLKAVDWQTAAGLVGQLIIVIRLVLYIAILIIFLVALVIINNSMVTATMDRVAEIGTMRAIGAQRRFVLVMFILETLVLGTVMGTLGAGLGVLTLEILGSVGIPAPNEILRFLFAGPRLYPDWSAWNVGFAVLIIFLVSVISTLYPALIATRVQPVVAMRGRD